MSLTVLPQNLDNFHIFSLAEPPLHFAELLFERAIGLQASQLLADPSFEPGIPEHLRRAAAASIETIGNGGYLLQNVYTREPFVAQTAFLLDSSRPANPCICITFKSQSSDQCSPRLLSLLLYNEFQMPLGIFDHRDNCFLVYAPLPLLEAQSFLVKECGHELIHSLVALDTRNSLERLVVQGSCGQALAFGFNKSFGHAHWNDVLGQLHRRRLACSSKLEPNLSLGLIGPFAWLDPNKLIEEQLVHFSTTEACTEFLINKKLTVHVPIGFHIDQYYEDFWRYEVTADLDTGLKEKLKTLRSNSYPIVLLSLRDSELWRRNWQDRDLQIELLVRQLKRSYPDLGVIIDGLTALHQCAPIARENQVLSRLSSFMSAFGSDLRIVDISGIDIASKAAAYKVVDYAIYQWGSGGIIPDYAYSVHGLNVSAESDIIDCYSSPSCIVRLAKPALPNEVDVVFIPLECLQITESSFSLIEESAYSFVLRHMEDCGIINAY